MKKNGFLMIELILLMVVFLFGGCKALFPPVALEYVNTPVEVKTPEVTENPEVESTPGPRIINNSFLKVSLVAGSTGGTGNADAVGEDASFYTPVGITCDKNYVYVTDYDNHAIRRINKFTAEVQTIAGLVGKINNNYGSDDGIARKAGFYRPSGITNDESYLYVADSDNQAIRRIDKKTFEVITIAGTKGFFESSDGIGADARFSEPSGITIDESFLYVSDANDHTIRRIDLQAPYMVTTIAGTVGITGDADGIGTQASFSRPFGITSDGNFIYVVDTDNRKIRRIDKTSLEVKTLAGITENGKEVGFRFMIQNGITYDDSFLYVTEAYSVRKINKTTLEAITIAGAASNSGSEDGIGSDARFYYLAGIVNDGNALYVADKTNDIIRTIELNKPYRVVTLAGTVEEKGHIDGLARAARFDHPGRLATDDLSVYVTEGLQNAIRRIDKKTSEVETLSLDFGAQSNFYQPAGIANDGKFLYITDCYNDLIGRIDKQTLQIITIAGNTDGSESANGVGRDVGFNNPIDIISFGPYLYVADQYNYSIRRIDKATLEVITMAGSSEDSGYEDGIGVNARFDRPCGITHDESFLYVTDTYNHTIRMIELEEPFRVTTIAGSTRKSGSVDGIGAGARFDLPWGIINNGTYLYVTDYNNHTIRRIEKGTWRVETIAGASGSFGNIDGAMSTARFYHPYGITSDGLNIYFTDNHNNAVKKIE